MPNIDPDVRAILFDGYSRELASLIRRMRELAQPDTPAAELADELAAAAKRYSDRLGALARGARADDEKPRRPWRKLLSVRWRR